MAAKYPPKGQIFTLAGANITNAYAAANANVAAFPAGRNAVRFWAKIVLVGGSTITSVTLKLLQRYKDLDDHGAGTPGDWIAMPSSLDDSAGAAQPKGRTREDEHAFAGLGAGATVWKSFLLEDGRALVEAGIDAHANNTGAVGDSITVYAEQG